MNERKRSHLCENIKTVRKATFREINYTQELEIPETEFRQAASFEITKNGKKSVSRKSRSISVRQPINGMSLNINQLLKKFKSMKLIQERVKSPHDSIKFKGKNKKNTKLMTEGKSIGRDTIGDLAMKVERTLDKLKENYAVKFEDDLDIPFRSESEIFSKEEKKRILYEVGEIFDDINIEELRHFCKSEEAGIHVSLDYLRSNTFEAMAKKIQRWWRRQKTQRLIKRYISKISSISKFENLGLSNEETTNKNKIVETVEMDINEFDEEEKEEQKGETFDLQECCTNRLSGEKGDELRFEEELDHCKLREIQKEQLEKWSEIVLLMSQNKVESKEDIEQLYKEIINRSNLYKEKLQINSHPSNNNDSQLVILPSQIHNNNASEHKNYLNQTIQNETNNPSFEILAIQEFKAKEKKWRGLKKEESPSEDSIKQISEEFNAKKYVEYFDNEKYPIHSIKQSSLTINNTAQKELLLKLSDSNEVQKTGRTNKAILNETLEIAKSRLSNHTKSELSLDNKMTFDKLEIPHQSAIVRESKKLKHQIRKSVSDKFVKYQSLEDFKSIAKIKEKESVNLVEEQIPLIFSIDEEKQRKKAFEKEYQEFLFHEIGKDVEENMQSLMKKEFLSNSSSEFSHPSEFGKNYDTDMDQFCIGEVSNEKSESKHTENIDKASGCFERLDSKEIFSSLTTANESLKKHEEASSYNDASAKGVKVSELLGDTLMIEFLVEMGQYGNTFLKLKALLLEKNQPRTVKRINYGFLTDENEIMQFIRELSSNVLNEEPEIFKNLEVSTEPSALEMLRYMHEEITEEVFEDFEEDDPTVMVLPNRIFEMFWDKKSELLKYEKKKGIEENLEIRRQEYLKGLNKIFMRSCFDSFNECLDYERNYGPFGKPFPWKKSQIFFHIQNSQSIRESIINSQNRLLEICSTNCGNLGDNEYAQEEKLSNMLAKDVIENEERWIFYDDEETELLVQASNLLFHGLLEEFKFELLDNNSSNFFF